MAIMDKPPGGEFSNTMEHITDDMVNNIVVGPGGEELGRVKAVEDGKAIVEAGADLGDTMLDAVDEGETHTHEISPNDIESVADERIYLHSSEGAGGTAPGEKEGRN